MKKVSAYVKGNRNAPTYYRIYQYLDNVQGCQVKYRQMYADWVHDNFMPLSKQNILIKVFALLHAYLRMTFSLISEFIHRPDVVVIHRRVLVRYMPYTHRILLSGIAKQSKIIWDFDDNILESREVSSRTLAFYARVSSDIIVTSDFLKELLPVDYRDKVCIMPTTDGGMYREFSSNPTINNQRLQSFDHVVELVWVATSVNLPYLEAIVPQLEAAAKIMRNGFSMDMVLNVVCNQPLNVHTENLTVNNIKWTRQVAIQTIFSSHIGIMPLENNNFTKGKGGFKLVQYMSAGLPCLASDVGYNRYVVSAHSGKLIEESGSWTEAVIYLADREHWLEMSKGAYSDWLDKFSYQKNLDRWDREINS